MDPQALPVPWVHLEDLASMENVVMTVDVETEERKVTREIKDHSDYL